MKGENGSGKSTLVKTLLKELKAKEGNYCLELPFKKISYLPQMNKESQSIHIQSGIFWTFIISRQLIAILFLKGFSVLHGENSWGEKAKSEDRYRHQKRLKY